jgi:sulfite exporter TauE/SafE
MRAIAIARGWWTVRPSGGVVFRRGLTQLRGRRAATRAWLIGVLTGFLPCGWLWAFVVAAAGTAGPWTGATLMVVFWLGTLPAMTGLLALGGPVLDRIRRKLPVVSACVLIALGLATLAARWRDAGPAGVTAPHCHRSAP